MGCAHLHAAFGSGPEGWPVDPVSDRPVPSPSSPSAARGRRGSDPGAWSSAQDAWPLLGPMLERGLRSPPTSSMGRLFDAVAAILGVRSENAYEGQAAMELEALADPTAERRYGFGLSESDGGWLLDSGPVIRGVAEDAARRVAPAQVAGAFHRAVAGVVVDAASIARDERGIDTVALTGGVFQNVLLTELSADALEVEGFRVLLHRDVPCNDGGLSLGQAVVAGRRMRAGTTMDTEASDTSRADLPHAESAPCV